MEAQTAKKEIGDCLCLKSAYKHFIKASLEESIHNREEIIDAIKKDIEEMRLIIIPNQIEAITFHRSTLEELTKVRNIVNSIPSCAVK